MKEIFIFCLLIGATSCVGCQSSTNLELKRALFWEAINHEVAMQQFQICSLPCQNIYLFDYGNIMPEVVYSEDVCDKSVMWYNTASLDHPTPSSLVLYRFDLDDDGAILSMTRPYSGAAVTFIFKAAISGGSFNLVSTEVGTF